ncbi:MAG: uracil-DNA glycosylase [Pseudomonadota bacterium]|nr:uracil-DNA glycosylase [Pseudomonadota bacterium]
MRKIIIEETWKKKLKQEFDSDYMKELSLFLRTEKKEGKILYPPAHLIFKCFYYTPFDQVKVVVLGQDPYHGPGQAQGLSFSISNGEKKPPSLINIFKELESDLNIMQPPDGDLKSWAKQGVLLLNSCLTVQAGRPGSHQGRGWERFTDKALKLLSEKKSNLVFILWGKSARRKSTFLDKNKHLIIESVHPSPFSAHYGFFGSKPFSQTNNYLKKNGIKPIDWS